MYGTSLAVFAFTKQHLKAEVYFGPSQTSMIEIFVRRSKAFNKWSFI